MLRVMSMAVLVRWVGGNTGSRKLSFGLFYCVNGFLVPFLACTEVSCINRKARVKAMKSNSKLAAAAPQNEMIDEKTSGSSWPTKQETQLKSAHKSSLNFLGSQKAVESWTKIGRGPHQNVEKLSCTLPKSKLQMSRPLAPLFLVCNET